MSTTQWTTSSTSSRIAAEQSARKTTAEAPRSAAEAPARKAVETAPASKGPAQVARAQAEKVRNALVNTDSFQASSPATSWMRNNNPLSLIQGGIDNLKVATAKVAGTMESDKVS